jgi:hypothetical protein
MIPDEFESEFSKRLLTMRIILGALLAGVATFAGITAFLWLGGQFQARMPADLLTYVGLAYTAGTAMAYALVPGRIVRAARWRIVRLADPASKDAAATKQLLRLCDVYQTQMIVRAALLEGTVFVWLIFFLMTGQWYMFGVAVAAALLLAMNFPTADGVSRWLAQQQEMMELERRLG